MGKFGTAAVQATKRLSGKKLTHPVEEWLAAVRENFPKSRAAQTKSCPRGAFLGLCYAGLLKNVSAVSPETGEDISLNGTYAEEAVEALRKAPDLANWTQAKLWRTTSGQSKGHNHQMDVVLALWREKLIVGS